MFWVILGELYRVLVSSPEIWSISPSPSSPARISQLQNPLTRRVIRERPFPSLTPSFVCLKVWFPAYSFFFLFSLCRQILPCLKRILSSSCPKCVPGASTTRWSVKLLILFLQPLSIHFLFSGRFFRAKWLKEHQLLYLSLYESMLELYLYMNKFYEDITTYYDLWKQYYRYFLFSLVHY